MCLKCDKTRVLKGRQYKAPDFKGDEIDWVIYQYYEEENCCLCNVEKMLVAKEDECNRLKLELEKVKEQNQLFKKAFKDVASLVTVDDEEE